MFTLKQIVVLALFGTTFATPIAHWGHHRDSTDGPIGGRMRTSPWGSKDDYVVVVGTNTNKDSDSTPTVPAPQTTTPAASTGGSAGSTDTGYMKIVNEYRTKMGLTNFQQSGTLEKNALKTANDGHGKMVHQLNPGSMGQVLAPGTADNFKSVFVGGWLCERPNLPGLNGECASMTKGWSHDGQTGHADILSSTKYKNIGCALGGGIWACDVS